MFMQFLQTQASVQASQPPSIKSKCKLNSKVFTGKEFSIEQIHEQLKTFEIGLSFMILNLDCMPTPETCIAYVFSCTSGTAQGQIGPKIQAKYYQNKTDVIQDFKNLFSDPDLEFYAQHRLIRLRQANKFFAKFSTDFSKYAACSDFNDKALKCHLRCALSEELSCQLVSINLKDLTYHQLVQECQIQDKQLRAAAVNTCKIMPRPQPSVKFNQ